jgi:geranyl-CoA carboxylase alpha subunit
MRSARALGYRTVAEFSEADADAPQVLQADGAVRIGPPAAAESGLKTAARLVDRSTGRPVDPLNPRRRR